MDCRNLINRINNFYGEGNSQECHYESDPFFLELNGLKEGILVDIATVHGVQREQALKMVFTRTFNFAMLLNNNLRIFDKGSPFYDEVFKACMFTSLCIFIHTTKRIKGMSLTEFVKRQNTAEYLKDNKQYFVSADTERLRKFRSRALSQKPVYNKRQQWSAMSLDSEHEWSFYYVLGSLDNSLSDVYKRISNLYNDIYSALRSTKNSDIQAAYKKFMSKLKKIKYADFLKLQEKIQERILLDKAYYGFNIYRLERSFRTCIIIDEVKNLLNCKSEDEKKHLILKSITLNDIWFPTVYKKICSVDNIEIIKDLATMFTELLNIVVYSSRLVLDVLISEDSENLGVVINGYLGEDWDVFICNTINQITEDIFYDPTKINFTAPPDSQESFERIVAAPVEYLIAQAQIL